MKNAEYERKRQLEVQIIEAQRGHARSILTAAKFDAKAAQRHVESWLIATVTHEVYANFDFDTKDACELLGVELGESGKNDDRPRGGIELEAFAGDGGAQSTKALLALVLVDGIDSAGSLPYLATDELAPTDELHYAFLRRTGYTPSEAEQAELDRVADRAGAA